MISKDTIIGVATATGRSSVSVLRISGKDTFSKVQKLFRNAKNKPLKKFQSHRIYYGWIEYQKKKIDEILLLVMKHPRSYTREDLVEIHSHGGVMVCNRLLEIFLKQGIRMAENGEFTKRAFLNGRIDLTKAEATLQIIDAQNLFSLEAGIEQLQGKLYEKICLFQKKISWILALLNAQIDFIEEDVFFINQDKSLQKIQSIILEIQEFVFSSQKGKKIQEGIRVVFMGKTNVGKSSIMNGVMRENRVIVTSEAGTTRDIIQESTLIQGVSFYFSDTAGIRLTDSIVEKAGIIKSWEALKQADILLWIIDAQNPDYNIAWEKISAQKIVLFVFNKKDLITKPINNIPKQLQKYPQIFISAFEKKDIEKLEKKIFDLYFEAIGLVQESVLLSNHRQISAAKESLKYLKKALKNIQNQQGEEIICFELEQALHALTTIVGETTNEDLLDKIFKNFCLGK